MGLWLPQFFLTWQCHEVHLDFKKSYFHVIHCYDQLIKQQINDHIFELLFWSFSDTLQGVKYIVAKSGHTMALTAEQVTRK